MIAKQYSATRKLIAAYTAVILADSPVAYWRLGEASGTTAADASGNGHAGTYQGGYTLRQTGIPGGGGNAAVGLDGSSGCVDVAGGIALPDSWSVEAWVWLVSLPVSFGEVVASANTPDAQNYIIEVTAAGLARTGSSADSFLRASGPFSLSTGAWYHLVGTYDATSHIYTCYADGVAGTPVVATQTPSSGPQRLRIGGYNGSASSLFVHGVIDEVALYGTALSAARIMAHYAAGA